MNDKHHLGMEFVKSYQKSPFHWAKFAEQRSPDFLAPLVKILASSSPKFCCLNPVKGPHVRLFPVKTQSSHGETETQALQNGQCPQAGEPSGGRADGEGLLELLVER